MLIPALSMLQIGLVLFLVVVLTGAISIEPRKYTLTLLVLVFLNLMVAAILAFVVYLSAEGMSVYFESVCHVQMDPLTIIFHKDITALEWDICLSTTK